MDIKDIKRAMDNMPMGDGSAFAEISVGPAKHEQFLDEHYGKVALIVLLCILGAAGWIIYSGMQESMEKKPEPLWWPPCLNLRPPERFP